MRTKVVFMLIDMNVGGTEKAWLNMISEMPKDVFDITLLLLNKRGGFLPMVPEHVRVEAAAGYEDIKDLIHQPLHRLAWQHLRSGRAVRAVHMMYLYMLSRIFPSKRAFYKSLMRRLPDLEGRYDLAVAFAGPMDFISCYVIHKIKAEKKFQWIHFDVAKAGFNRSLAAGLYKQFDKIFVVSEEGRRKFIEQLPGLEQKTAVFVNRISPDAVHRMADEGEGFADGFAGMRILTVGRLSKEKGQDLAISVLARLRREGYNVRWYCIGDGKERAGMERMIREHGLEADFILMGTHTNPYPFMKQCDIYVQPSRHEGYCITLAEAKCFHKPIVSTNFTGAAEQIEHERTGLLVDFDEEQMTNAIRRLIDNEMLRTRFRLNAIKGANNEKSADHAEQYEYRRRGEIAAFPAVRYFEKEL